MNVKFVIDIFRVVIEELHNVISVHCLVYLMLLGRAFRDAATTVVEPSIRQVSSRPRSVHDVVEVHDDGLREAARKGKSIM